MHFVKFLPRYLQQSVMKMQNLIKLGKNCKNILFRDNHLPFIQEQLMEKIKVNYKLALCSCHYHFPHCHHVTTYLWINTKLENWCTSGTACLILLLFRRGICHKSHDPGLFKIFLGLGKNIKNQCINFPSLLNLPNLGLRRWSFSQKLESSVCLPLSRKTDNLLKYMSKKYSIFKFWPKI